MLEVTVIPGVEISVIVLLLLGIAVGIVSGFAGVGGGFIVTPALIILGIPANYAVGTSLLWVMGNSVIGTLRHRQQGNVDLKLAIVVTAFVMCGVEIGVRTLNWVQGQGLASEVVLIVSVVILLLVGSFMFRESIKGRVRHETGDSASLKITVAVQSVRIPPVIRFNRSGISVSLLVLAGIGLLTGVLAGLIGVGGGFLMVPSMVYLLGVPSFMAVGTDLSQIVVSAAFGSFRHIVSGNVLIYLSIILLLGSSIGVQFGALATRYLKGVCMRFVLAVSILTAVIGSICKLISLAFDGTDGWLQTVTIAVTFGGLGMVTILIIGLLIAGVRYCHLCRLEPSPHASHPLFKETVI